MKTFSIKTVGCKVNQYESQQIRQFLEGLGWSQARRDEQSKLVVVNTCCVTLTASAKSRQSIRRAVKSNPNSDVVVCGCLPAVNTGELNNLETQNIHLITNRNNLVPTLNQITGHHPLVSNKPTQQSPDIEIKTRNSCQIKDKYPNLPLLSLLTSFNGQTRAFLKVQDGCDGCCSYCIIPKTRPKVESKETSDVLKEAQQLVNAGHKEIVVTGIFLGAYGQDTVLRKKWPEQQNDKLPEMLEKLAKIPNLARIRLSSLEPTDVTERLLDCFCNNPNIMPHLHLSIQSGSDNVLKKMCRQYRQADILEKVELIRSRLDRPAITCDLIAGFPGETDEDFEQTVRLAEQVGFAKMHVFSFSLRAGTAAANFRPAVEPSVLKRRAQILQRLDAELGFQFRQQFVGQEEMILTETANGNCLGRCQRYFYVQIENPDKSIARNQLIKVKLLKNTNKLMTGAVSIRSDENLRTNYRHHYLYLFHIISSSYSFNLLKNCF
jgi:threonylcarbamoyladenosine tRNA methylthiotransferase MtaB